MIDGSHSAFTEFTLDAVAAFEGCVQAGDGVGVAHAAEDAAQVSGARADGLKSTP